jgi:hypothetical protein
MKEPQKTNADREELLENLLQDAPAEANLLMFLK